LEQFELCPINDVPEGFVTENRRYEIEAFLDGQPLAEQLVLTLNDIPADRIQRGKRRFFLLEVGFYAGDLRVAVLDQHRVVSFVDLVVDADKAKLTRDEYAALVADVARLTSALYRLGAVTLPAAGSVSGDRTLLSTLDLVRTNFDGFERAVSRIANGPTRQLRSETVVVPLQSARRVDSRSLSAALRRGWARTASPSESLAAPRLVEALGGQWIERIGDSHKEERLDTEVAPEIRTVG
jgi:hypothetical protein|tara:strand:- start:9 stop:725 length:717 start_codon:yes stop_codon:yes gene_type:complete